MFLFVCFVLIAASLFSAVYTFKYRTIRLFWISNPTDQKEKNRAVRNVGIMYVVSTFGLILSTILYYTTTMGIQPFTLIFAVTGTWAIMLRIHLTKL